MRNCEKYRLATLLIDSEEDEMDEQEETLLNANTFKKEVYDLMATRQYLIFLGIYMEKYQTDMKKKLENLDRKISVAECKYTALWKKQVADENMLATIGGAFVEGLTKFADMTDALREFYADNRTNKLIQRLNG